MLQNTKLFDNLLNVNCSFAERLVNAIKKIAANLRNFFKENPLEAKTEYGQALLEAMNKVENRVQELWDEAVAEGIRAENKNAATEGGIKYKSRDDIRKLNISWDSDNSSTIKKQMQEHLPEISSLPIAKEFVFDKQNGDYVQQLKNILKVWNYQINRQDGISFLFDDEAIKTVRHYVHSDEEATAAIVASYVLKRGKIITGHKNHKNKGLVSITIDAPVKINGQLAYEGVAVKFDKKDRVHSLRIVDTNGNQFVFYKQEKTKSSTNRAGSEESESDLPSNFPSENSLPQAESENNSFSKKSSDRFNDTDYLSAVEHGDMATAQQMVDEAAKAAGYNIKAYHGTARADRVGNVFRPECDANPGEDAYLVSQLKNIVARAEAGELATGEGIVNEIIEVAHDALVLGGTHKR